MEYIIIIIDVIINNVIILNNQNVNVFNITNITIKS